MLLFLEIAFSECKPISGRSYPCLPGSMWPRTTPHSIVKFVETMNPCDQVLASSGKYRRNRLRIRRIARVWSWEIRDSV
jgi:hypothetical protein